ncbi:MAG TPA: class I SAM-dependent methyltransferase [Solirubrobacteraceae bacterium]|nr:class I SAM-dependent methyltransferase [Solirubrobacteraceae bacterium]
MPGPRRGALRHPGVELRWYAELRALPPRVAWFQARARALAHRDGDRFSLTSVTRPRDLRTLLSLADGRRTVVELGTATGWTAISLALADPARRVTTFDIVARPEPARYLRLTSADVRARIELVTAAGADGPRDDRPVDLLYVDSSHERQQTVDEVAAWRPALAPGAAIVFDDYDHPDYPGVRDAVDELGLAGRRAGTLFVATA